MATAGYATVLAKNGKKAGCKNLGAQGDGKFYTCGTGANAGTAGTAADTPAGAVEGDLVEGGLGVYQEVPDAVGDFQFIWALSIKAAGSTTTTTNTTDGKKSATTLAIGAAAGLVAAAIA